MRAEGGTCARCGGAIWQPKNREGNAVRYRSKPSEIEAVQWTGDNFEEVRAFWPDGIKLREPPIPGWERETALLMLAGKDGAQEWVPVPWGHWIVRQPGDLSDHWPVDPDYFAKKYEPA